MNNYICKNSECADYAKRLKKEVSYIILNSKVFNTATVCEECGQQLDTESNIEIKPTYNKSR